MAIFCMNYEEKYYGPPLILNPTNVSFFVHSTKIGTHGNKAIHSILEFGIRNDFREEYMNAENWYFSSCTEADLEHVGNEVRVWKTRGILVSCIKRMGIGEKKESLEIFNFKYS